MCLAHMQLLRITYFGTHAVLTCDTQCTWYDRHETERTVGHIFGANFVTHAVFNTYCTDTYDRHEAETTVGHILEANFVTHAFFNTYCPDTYDRHDAETTVGHIFGANLSTHAVVTRNTYCP